MIIPGVQKPHCRPWCSMKPSWIGCSPSAVAMPSTVSTSPPSAWTANTVQLLTERPSRSTVQAPQWLVSQPMCAPVRPISSRRKWISSMRGSTSASTALPFTVSLMCCFAMLSLPRARVRAAIARRTMTPATCLRNSAGPRRSEAGSVIATAAAAAFTIAAPSTGVPISACPAASASNGTSARLVSAIRASRQAPPSMTRSTAAAAVA